MRNGSLSASATSRLAASPRPDPQMQTKWPEQPWRKWYKTARWQRLRAAQLQREPLCRMCHPRLTVATVCDHITPHRGDVVKFWNGPFMSVCEPCHNGAKQQFEKTGKVRGCDAKGIPFASLVSRNPGP